MHAAEHVVRFYETDASLLDAVATFCADAILADGAALVVATAEHRAGIAERLRARGLLDADGNPRLLSLTRCRRDSFAVHGRWRGRRRALHGGHRRHHLAGGEDMGVRCESSGRWSRSWSRTAIPPPLFAWKSSGTTCNCAAPHARLLALLRLSDGSLRRGGPSGSLQRRLRGALPGRSRRELYGAPDRERPPAGDCGTAAEGTVARDRDRRTATGRGTAAAARWRPSTRPAWTRKPRCTCGTSSCRSRRTSCETRWPAFRSMLRSPCGG